MAVLIFFTIRNIAIKIEKYQQDLLNLSRAFASIDESLNERTAKLSSAELLLNNTNKILSTVYFGTADSDEKQEAKDFTAFSIMYKDKFYLITAGHCIEYENVKYKNFKFKANNEKDWITPALVAYENDYNNNIDYAIFYSDNLINMGLLPALKDEDMVPQYMLGNLERGLNLIKKYKDAREGESGSPILNTNCHVVGIITKKDGSYTPIHVVLDEIDKLKIN